MSTNWSPADQCRHGEKSRFRVNSSGLANRRNGTVVRVRLGWHVGRLRLAAGSAGRRGYQAIFVPSAALDSPGYDGQPAVYLHIAALEVNVLNCREVRVL